MLATQTPHLRLPILSITATNTTISVAAAEFLRLHRRRLRPILSTATATVAAAKDPKPVQFIPKEELSDTRVVAFNIPWEYTVEDIRPLYEKFGTVIDVELSMFNKSRNRGLVFVEMGSKEEAAEVIKSLDGSEYEGRTLKVLYAKPKKRKGSLSPDLPRVPLLYHLFVANLSYDVRSKDLKELFASNGDRVAKAEVIFQDNLKRSSGFGFVAFGTKREADRALKAFQGKELNGRPIRVEKSKPFVRIDLAKLAMLSQDVSKASSPSQSQDTSEDSTPQISKTTLQSQDVSTNSSPSV